MGVSVIVAEIESTDGNPRLQGGRLKFGEAWIDVNIDRIVRDNRIGVRVNRSKGEVEMSQTFDINLLWVDTIAKAIPGIGSLIVSDRSTIGGIAIARWGRNGRAATEIFLTGCQSIWIGIPAVELVSLRDALIWKGPLRRDNHLLHTSQSMNSKDSCHTVLNRLRYNGHTWL